MIPYTITVLSDVVGCPRAKVPLPAGLRLGDKVVLRFSLRRQKGGRSEVLEVKGEFKVVEVYVDASSGVSHQVIHISSTGVAPAWRAVKRQAAKRTISPARFPPTEI